MTADPTDTGELRGVMPQLDLVAYQPDAVVSRTLIKKPAGTVTAFAFDAGEGLSEHTAPYDALVLGVDGEAEICIASSPARGSAGPLLKLPDVQARGGRSAPQAPRWPAACRQGDHTTQDAPGDDPSVEGWDANSSDRLSCAFLEHPAIGLVFGAGHLVAALVCRGGGAHQHALFPASTYRAVAAGPLGAGVHRHQSLSDLAHLPRATPRRAFPR